MRQFDALTELFAGFMRLIGALPEQFAAMLERFAAISE
jgi:hypothetical protein